MRKFSLILSCFIAGTCGIERSVWAVTITEKDIQLVDILAAENQKRQNALGSIEENKNNSVRLWQVFENYAFNECTPYSSEVIYIWQKQEAHKMNSIQAYLCLIREKLQLPQKALSVALAEGIMSAACGALWNVEIDPDKKGHILRPQTEKQSDRDVFASNPYETIHKNLCEIKIENDFTNLKVKKMSDDERYVYNQNLGLLVWNAGLNAVETKLKSQLEQALRNKNDNLARAILVQIRNAYYWAMLRNPSKADDLFKQYTELYKTPEFKFSNSLSIKKIRDIDNLGEKLKPLFESFTGFNSTYLEKNKENVNLSTKLGTKVKSVPAEDQSETLNYVVRRHEDFYDNSANTIDLTVNIGIKVKAGLTDNSCFAICGSIPLLARGILSDPRLETNIIDIKRKALNIKDNSEGFFEPFAKTAYSHFGYRPLVLTKYKHLNTESPAELDLKNKLKNSLNHDDEYGDIIFEDTSIYPFLPIYLSSFSQAHYELFCRNLFEMGVKREIKKRICNLDGEGITQNLVNAYKNRDTKSSKTKLIELLNTHQQLKNLVDNSTDLIPYKKFQENVISNYINGDYGKPNEAIFNCDDFFKSIIQELKKPEMFNSYELGKVLDDNKKYEDNNYTNAQNKLQKIQETIINIETEIQKLVNKMANDSYFQATPENSIDPLLPMFSQRTDNFAYRK